MTAAQSDHDTLLGLNEAYIRSVQAGDVAWFQAHLAEDFHCSNPDATLVDKAGFLAQTARPVPIRSLSISDVKIRDLGHFAIIHARTHYQTPDGQQHSGRYTDVWARRGDRWLAVSAHVTR